MGGLSAVFGFRGRLARLPFAIVFAVHTLLGAYGSIWLQSLTWSQGNSAPGSDIWFAALTALWGNYGALAAVVKRLHDFDRSVRDAFRPGSGGLRQLFACFTEDGTPGPNRFGPDPA